MLNSKQKLKNKREKTKINPRTLMRYRIEEMNRKLYEKCNQSKKTTKSREN